MTILITGGAGYIGSHVAHLASDEGMKIVVLDNLSTGLRALVPESAVLVEGDVADASLVRGVIAKHNVKAIIHFAGSVVVPESVSNPLSYYGNNTCATRSLLSAAIECDIENFIFSSTAAVYGDGHSRAVTEADATAPQSPYGRSKLMTEWMLDDIAKAHPFRYVALRYFNVAGADVHGRTGQSTPRATHLIKRACQVALGRAPFLEIFGTDYGTADGTGVRDFIHVWDLANAHLAALRYLQSGKRSVTLNCGYGHGSSVKDVIRAVERASGQVLPYVERPRRSGDIASVVADASLIKKTLHWSPRYDDLDFIVSSALSWERRVSSN